MKRKPMKIVPLEPEKTAAMDAAKSLKKKNKSSMASEKKPAKTGK